MESLITLTADNKIELNKLIDINLKSGYLIHGAMHETEQGRLAQIMIQPNNIDGEVTLKGMTKFVIGAIIYVVILYYIF